MIKIEELLKTKGREEVKKAIKRRQQSIAGMILYGDCMDTKDPNLTQADLLRHELKCLNWVMEKLPKEMIQNPNYNPEEDIQDMEEQDRAELIDGMFKQEV